MVLPQDVRHLIDLIVSFSFVHNIVFIVAIAVIVGLDVPSQVVGLKCDGPIPLERLSSESQTDEVHNFTKRQEAIEHWQSACPRLVAIGSGVSRVSHTFQ